MSPLGSYIRLTGVPVHKKRFGFASVGSPPSTPTGTDFRHEHHRLTGVPVHRKRFGFAPVGSGGGAVVPSNLPIQPTPFGALGNLGLAFRI
jgi:hypothetical protein